MMFDIFFGFGWSRKLLWLQSITGEWSWYVVGVERFESPLHIESKIKIILCKFNYF